MDYINALNKVKENGMFLRHIPHFNNNRHIVLTAVVQNGLALRYASDELKNNKAVVIAAVSQHQFLVYEYPPTIWHTESVSDYISPELRADKEVILNFVSYNGYALDDLPEYCNDFDVVVTAISNNRSSIRYANYSLLNDLNFALTVISIQPKTIKYIQEWQSNKELVLLAIQGDERCTKYCNKSLYSDAQFIRRLINLPHKFNLHPTILQARILSTFKLNVHILSDLLVQLLSNRDML